MKAAAIIQARIESTRMPGKILLPLAGEMALIRVIERVALAERIDEIIVACPDTPPNQVIQTIQMRYVSPSLLATNFKIYAGPMHDVIQRVVEAAIAYQVDVIVDVTCDCPLVDPRHIDMLVQSVTEGGADYASNVYPRSWPDGFDVQVYPKKMLEYAHQAVTKLMTSKRVYHTGWNITHHRDYIEKRLGRRLVIHNYNAPQQYNLPFWGLTLDAAEDFETLCHVYDHFYKHLDFSAKEVIDWLRANPHLITNTNVRRKEPEEG